MCQGGDSSIENNNPSCVLSSISRFLFVEALVVTTGFTCSFTIRDSFSFESVV